MLYSYDVIVKGSVFMRYRYETKGTCSRIVKDVKYTGGCGGNLQGIAKLVDGMKVEEVIEKLKGIGCGMKSTSCPDQLSKALSAVIEKKGE